VTLNQIISAADIAAGRLRFVPDADENASPYTTIGFKVGDGTVFSTSAYTLTVNVTAVNDAPLSTNDTLSIAEDTTTVLSVNDFGSYSDVDLDALAAVQITTLETDGALEYDTTGAGAWAAVTLNQIISAADIAAGRLRFVPDADENASPYTTIGFKVGDGTVFSTSAYTLTVNVTAVNDAPVVTADASTAYTQNASAVVVDSSTPVTDVDDTNIESATVTISNVDRATDVLTLNAAATTAAATAGITVTAYNPATGELVLSGTATEADYQTVLEGIQFSSTSATAGNRSISYVVNDGNVDSAATNATIVYSVLNNAPVVAGAGGTLAYIEGDGTQLIDATLAITDVDDTNIESATISISGGFVSGEDVLAFVNMGNITGSWDGGTGILTLTGTDTLANYEAALESITYENTNTDNPNTGNRTITWVVNDGSANSAGVTSTITVAGVNDAPVSTNDTLSIAEDTTTVLSVNDFGSYSDVDLDALAAVQITTLETDGALEYDTTGAGAWAAVTLNQIISAADIAAGRLRFVPDADENASPYTTIGFKVGDGTVFSAAAYTLTVNVTAVNDAPVVTADASTAYTQSAPAVVVDSSVPVTDVDDTNIESATITISSVDRTNDSLTLNAAATTAAATAGITVTAYNSATGELVLSGTATKAEYQAVLEGVQFSSTSATAGNRSISYVGNDGNVNSAATNATIVYSTLNAAPRIDDAALALNENSTIGTAVYNVNEFFTGNDTDLDGDVLSYLITAGNGLGGFAINAATGQVTVANSAALDFETTPVFSLTVEASDGTLTDTAVMTVNLNDLNEAPVASVTVGLNNPDLGAPPGMLPPVTLNPGVESGQLIGGPELSHRDFVLQGINESLRLRTEQAAQIAGLLTAANAGEIEAVSLGDDLQMEPAMFVLPAVEQIRSEFNAAGERALEFGAKPAPGTAPLLKDFDAFSRFVGLDEPKDEPEPAAEPTPDAPAGAQDSAPAEAAPDAAAAPNAGRDATRDSQPAGAAAFSAQLRTAAALRKQLDTRLAESLRPPRKS
jgi:hypothetical protein